MRERKIGNSSIEIFDFHYFIPYPCTIGKEAYEGERLDPSDGKRTLRNESGNERGIDLPHFD